MTKLHEDILKLRIDGKTYNQIQLELGCSKGTISYYLGKNQKDKTRERSQSRREKIRNILKKIKEKAGCSDCQTMHPYYMLDFDHTGDDKIDALSVMTRWYPIEDIMKEIQKCEVVCANCHRIRSYKRQRGLPL